MFKEKLIGLWIYWAQRSKKSRNNVAYDASTNFGIIYSKEIIGEEPSVKELSEQLQGDGKHIQTLEFVSQEASGGGHICFGVEDFSVFGKLRTDQVMHFVQTPFDYLICLDAFISPYMKYILVHSQAACRIGRFDDQHYDYFEVMIKQQTADGLGNTFYEYLKKMR